MLFNKLIPELSVTNLENSLKFYKTIGFNIWQYTGCVRPILFTFSELFCFYLVLILTVVHICFKNKVINIIYFIFFLCNFVFLCLTYFISKEVKELLTASDEFYIFLVGNIIFL